LGPQHGLRLRLRLSLWLRLASPLAITLALRGQLRLGSRLGHAVPDALTLRRELRLGSRLGQAVPDALTLRRELRLGSRLGQAAPDALTLRRELRLGSRLGQAAPDTLTLLRELRLSPAITDPGILGLVRCRDLAARMAGRDRPGRILPPVIGVLHVWLFFANDDGLTAPVVQVKEPGPLPGAAPCAVEVVKIIAGMDVIIHHRIRVIIILVVGWRVGCGINYPCLCVVVVDTARYARHQCGRRRARHQSNKFPSFHDRFSNISPAECVTAANAGLRP
jgi:hypothetical protein